MTRTARFRRGVAPRIAADVLIVAASLLGGFLIRLMIAVRYPHAGSPAELAAFFRHSFLHLATLLACILVAIFAISGVYTRKQLYAQRYKTLALVQGISLSYAVFVLVAYLSWYGQSFLAPWGAFLISFALTLAGAIGARRLKSYLAEQFRIEPKKPATDRTARSVLVVGGAGYIGSVLVRDLLRDRYRVRVLDSLACGDESIRELYGHAGFELVAGDFRRVEPVVRAAKGMDAVIHLGAIVGDPACAVNEDETLETNLAATRLLADVCRASGVSRMLFASTCSVYGAAEHLVDERSGVNPVSLYAATKIDSERVLLAAGDRRLHPVILRLGTAFGWSHRPRFDLVVNLLAARAAFEGKIQIFNGDQWRPFIHVADISRAFRLALRAPLEVVAGEVFNAGSDSMNRTLAQLAGEIALLRPDLNVEYVNNSDRRNYKVSFEKIRGRLGFERRVSLAAGISELFDALDRGLVTDYQDPRYSNVQLVAQRLQEKHGDDHIELTALRFAKNSRWWRTMVAGGSGDDLLRSASAAVALAQTRS